MPCTPKGCSANTDCFTVNTQQIITSNNCCDPNNNCACNGTTCASTSCTDDTYCANTFGSGCACVGGLCTCQPCANSDNAPPNMYCNGGIYSTKSCDSRSDCGDNMRCQNGYCVRASPVPLKKLIAFIIIAIIACMIAGGFYVYGKKFSTHA